jgi:hypothetical protein
MKRTPSGSFLAISPSEKGKDMGNKFLPLPCSEGRLGGVLLRFPRYRGPVGLLLLLSLSLCLPAMAATRVTLPDSAAYSYWVQSPSGTVSVMPVGVNSHSQFTLPSKASSGTLNVLDAHTGNIATVPLTGQNLTLTVSEFKPLASPTPTAAPMPVPAPVTPTATPPVPETSGIARLFTLVFGLIVAGGVGWAIWRLVQSRGQPLIDVARKMGVDVPDPTGPLPEEQAAPVYTPPTPRAVEKIPDEAGVTPPTPAPMPRRATVGTLEAPQIVGVQGVAAGSVFAVPIGETTIGRSGDNGIVLAEHTVSRLHARLRRDVGGQIMLTDNNSTSGVYVNGERITDTTLNAGDQIQIGDNYFRLEA